MPLFRIMAWSDSSMNCHVWQSIYSENVYALVCRAYAFDLSSASQAQDVNISPIVAYQSDNGCCGCFSILDYTFILHSLPKYFNYPWCFLIKPDYCSSTLNSSCELVTSAGNIVVVLHMRSIVADLAWVCWWSISCRHTLRHFGGRVREL